jgi:hypothetical protein
MGVAVQIRDFYRVVLAAREGQVKAIMALDSLEGDS